MAHCSRTLQIGERYPKLKIKYAFFEKHGMYFSLPSTHLRGRHFENFSLVINIIFKGIRILEIALDSKIKTQYQYLYSRVVQIEVDRAGCHREKFI